MRLSNSISEGVHVPFKLYQLIVILIIHEGDRTLS